MGFYFLTWGSTFEVLFRINSSQRFNWVLDELESVLEERLDREKKLEEGEDMDLLDMHIDFLCTTNG